MIEGHFFHWQPANISDIFCENSDVMFSDKLPITGMLSRIDGKIGRLSYMQPDGKNGEITVLLSELIPVGVAHAE